MKKGEKKNKFIIDINGFIILMLRLNAIRLLACALRIFNKFCVGFFYLKNSKVKSSKKKRRNTRNTNLSEQQQQQQQLFLF